MKHSKTSFSLCPHQEETQCKCTEAPHRIFSATLSPTLALSTWISLLDPLFAVAPVTLVNYPMLNHPNGWIIRDSCNHNPKLLSAHPDKEPLQSFSSMNKLTDLNEVMEKIEDLNSHFFSLHIHWLHTASCLCSSFSTAKVSWQQSRDSHQALMLSEGTFSSPQGTARDCLKTFLAQLPYPCTILIPTSCPELQPCRKHQAFWQHRCGTSQLPALVAFSSVCF